MAKKKSKIGRYITIIVVLIVLVGSYFAFFANRGPAPIEVSVADVENRDIVQTVSAIGKIQPETEIKVSSQTSGEIIFLGVKEGDTVKAGQILIRIKPDIVEAQLAQQKAGADASKMEIDVRKAELDRSAANLDRIRDLYSKEFVSKQELDQALAAYQSANSSYQAALHRYEQALAAYRQVERTAERSSIYAPINGVITMLGVERGEKVVGTEMMQGTELMRISDLSVMNAIVEVDENDIVLLTLGDTTRVEIDAISDKFYHGYVFEIGHSAITQGLGTQEQTTNFQVKVR
jgi:HlyD family secretion protein